MLHVQCTRIVKANFWYERFEFSHLIVYRVYFEVPRTSEPGVQAVHGPEDCKNDSGGTTLFTTSKPEIQENLSVYIAK